MKTNHIKREGEKAEEDGEKIQKCSHAEKNAKKVFFLSLTLILIIHVFIKWKHIYTKNIFSNHVSYYYGRRY